MLALQAAENAPTMSQPGAEGGAQQAEAQALPELPNIFGWTHHLLESLDSTRPAMEKFNATVASWGFKDPLGTPVTAFENVFFGFLYIALLSAFIISGYKRLRKSPKEGTL